MATTTPNFGWAVPTSTDLVKDGAVAIETLGDAIDASLVDLKGGTTGQVLAKASGTDMDFSWVTDATGIPATIFDAKGDIIAATAADTASRLAVGSNNQVLTADSSTATGLKWATPAGGGKVLQVVGASTVSFVANSTTTLADTGLSASITPSSASSKIVVLINQVCFKSNGNINNGIKIDVQRNGTSIAGYDYLGFTGTAIELYTNYALSYLDSPATTSAITYKTQFANYNASAEVRVNGGGRSSIVLMEIGA
jgi:hypothetical protein